MSQPKTLMVTGGVLALLGGLYMYYKKNAQVLQNMAQFSIEDFKLKKPNFFTTPFILSVLIKNPSDIKLDVKNYIIEVYKLANGVKKQLAYSSPTSLTLPAQANIINDVHFEANNINLIGLIIGALQEGKEMQLKGKLSFKIKAEIAGQYIEKEFLY